jgi:cytosine/creatinine deaminase
VNGFSGSLLADQVAPAMLLGVTLSDGTIADVTLADGTIAAVTRADSMAAGAATRSEATGPVVSLDGYLLIPSLVEPHAHLDKALTADMVANPDGSLMGAIEAWMSVRKGFRPSDIAQRAAAIVQRYLIHGTTSIRAHVDTGEDVGLAATQAVTSVRDAMQGVVDVEIVACCSCPVTGRAGAANRSVLADALAAGADLVGGAPAIDDDPAGAVDILTAMAADAGVGVDLHTDETLDPSSRSVDRLIDVARSGFEYPVTASHLVSLGLAPAERQQAVTKALAEAGIAVVALPQTNLYLQGRGQGSLAPRGLTPVRRLLDAGVTVAAGGDNLQDPFNAMGRADPLETASLLAVTGHLSPAEAFGAVTSAGRRLMRRPAVTVGAGAPADLLAIRAGSIRAAMAGSAPDRIVLRAGRVVARTSVQTETVVGPGPDWRDS